MRYIILINKKHPRWLLRLFGDLLASEAEEYIRGKRLADYDKEIAEVVEQFDIAAFQNGDWLNLGGGMYKIIRKVHVMPAVAGIGIVHGGVVLEVVHCGSAYKHQNPTP